MLKVLTYEQIDRAEWGALVRTSRTGTWFQSPEAYALFASLPELMEPFVVGIERQEPRAKSQEPIANSPLRTVCVGYVTREKGRLRQFFTRRAIILGGPALADDATEEEVEMLMAAVKSLRTPYTVHHTPIYLETRNFNDYSRWRAAFEKAGWAYRPHLNFHVEPTSDWQERLSDNRKRQIRHVTNERMNELTNEGVGEGDIRAWYDILRQLYRTKVKTPLFPIDFFLEAYRRQAARFLLIKQDGHVIGGSMVAEDEGCVYEWFECGLNAEYKDQYPSVMATYTGIRYAASQGKRYDMMGAGEPGVPYGVRDFKAEFGGQMVEHGRFLCIRHPLLYRLGKTAVQIIRIQNSEFRSQKL